MLRLCAETLGNSPSLVQMAANQQYTTHGNKDLGPPDPFASLLSPSSLSPAPQSKKSAQPLLADLSNPQ